MGKVYLVGAGPGDPGLITVKGIECLKKADIVVYDYLANPILLKMAPPRSRKVYVGKRGSTHSKEQEEINRLLVNEAGRGRTVVRLKGGDPFVFGRGGEEAEALAEAGVPYEVVPGVTSAIAVPAYAGIPVTHRDFTSTVAFVTGHEKDEGGASPPDWEALSRIGTLVFLMGYANLSHIVDKLREAGMDPKTPAAVIEWGTTARQKTASGSLETIIGEVERIGIRPPTIIVVGRVVDLKEKIDWFGRRPLLGKKILVTRSRDQASDLSRLLEEEGAEAIEIPTIEIRPPSQWGPMDRALRSISKYDWLVFTSANGAEYFFNRLFHLKRDFRDLHGVKVAAIGPATARPIEKMGLRVDLTADEFRGEGLATKLAKQRIRGKKILIAQAAKAREVLRDELKRAGARVEVIEAYRTFCPREGSQVLREVLKTGKADLVTFASSVTVENFMKMAGVASEIPVACIGPITAKTARTHGLNVAIQPKKYTMPGLVEAVVDHFARRMNSGAKKG